ncbi:MAG: hypothetical protein V2A71_03345, partial [Candidatus Eisenbacteria bacterium]
MKKSKFITDFSDIPKRREKMPHLHLEERTQSFREVELGFDEEGAIRESRRCLSCRRCIGCGLCLAECDSRAVAYDDAGRTLKLKVGAIVLTPGLDEFDAGRIRELGYKQFSNVVTSIELERMLSPTGPYGGHVLRPSDGDIPSRIAFIQCVGSRSEAIGADFCSSICCMTALKESISLVGRIPGASITILHRDVRPLGKDSEEFYQKALAEERIAFVRAGVTSVKEVSETGNLAVEFSPGGGSRSEEFELVVLSVGIRASGTVRALSRKTGVRLNKFGFCGTDPVAVCATAKDGILAAGACAGPKDVSETVCSAHAVAAVALRKIGEPHQPQGCGVDAGVSDVGAESASVDGASDGMGARGAQGADARAPRAGRGGDAGESDRTAVLICEYGLSSGSSADLAQLQQKLKTLPGVSLVKSSAFLCAELSRQDLRDEIAKAGAARTIIVPCYESTYRPLFERQLGIGSGDDGGSNRGGDACVVGEG